MKPTLLQYPDFNKEFGITTDASNQACEAVLTQDYNNTQLPVAYASRSFTKGESSKNTTEQELAAIHWGINPFRPYIYGRHFTVKTDHRPLTYLFSMTNPSSQIYYKSLQKYLVYQIPVTQLSQGPKGNGDMQAPKRD